MPGAENRKMKCDDWEDSVKRRGGFGEENRKNLWGESGCLVRGLGRYRGLTARERCGLLELFENSARRG